LRKSPAGLPTKSASPRPAAEQLAEYLAAGRAALGELPTLRNIVLERFFDEAGGMQLVVHSPPWQPHQGYSLTDPDFQLVLKELHLIFQGTTPPHYALLPDPHDFTSEHLMKAMNIQVIAYSSKEQSP